MAETVNLTARTLEALKPGPKDYDVFDRTIPGFHVRVRTSGIVSFRLKYKAADGRQRRATLGTLSGHFTVAQARAEAERLRLIVQQGGDPMAQAEEAERAAEEARRRQITLADLIERYLTDGPGLNPNKRARSWAHDAMMLRNHVKPLIGNLLAHAVRRADVERMQADIIAGATARVEKIKDRPRAKRIIKGGEAAGRASTVALHTVFSWAIERELIDRNPVAKVKKPTPRTRERFLSDEETGRLLETLTAMTEAGDLLSVHTDEIRLLLLTGARLREITRLRWKEIDFERAMIRLPRERGKTGERVIHLSPPALQVLADRAPHGAFVFPGPRAPIDEKTKEPLAPADDLERPWRRLRKEAKLHDVRLHDLRHSFASFAAARGASLLLIGKLLGHRQAATTARYAHLAADPARDLAAQIGTHVTTAPARLAEAKERRARKVEGEGGG
jgi:integrase